ncbi:MAG: sodium-dependent bicarbonate transport family permease [Burkholderiales bacterium]
MLDPVVLFFLLGVFARLARSDLRVPEPLYDALSIYLLLALGLKGGVELARADAVALAGQTALAIGLGCLLPLLAFAILRGLGRLDRSNGAAIAAHYGSVSVVTFAAGLTYLNARNIPSEATMPFFVAVLEVPALLVGVLLARVGTGRATKLAGTVREALAGRSVVLLMGGLAIGALLGPEGIAPVKPLFTDLFKGALCLFLLELGLVVGGQVPALRQAGAFLVGFGLLVPPLFGAIGAACGWLMGLSHGGIALMATLAASASYIAAPAAMRMAIPEANPALSIAVVLGVTFPFNLVAGIPLYERLAAHIAGGS